MKKYTLIFLLLGIVINAISAQNLKAEIESVSGILNDALNLSYVIDIEVFNELQSENTPLYTRKLEIKKQADNYYKNIDGVLHINNKRGFLMVNEETRVIVFYPTTEEEPAAPDFVSPDYEQMATQLDKITFAGITGNTKHYIFENPAARDIVKTEFFFNLNTGFFERVILWYNEDLPSVQFNKIVMNYNDFSVTAPVSTSVFSEAPYVHVENGEVALQAAYGGYYLITR